MRLIDADALVERLGINERCSDCQYDNLSFCGKASEFVEACDAIFNAPTVPQWIPCSERQPTEDGEYITTVEDGEGMFVTSNDWRQDWKEWGFLSYYGESDEPAWRRVTNVVAWCELPAPYKEA